MILISNPGVGCKSTAITISDELQQKAIPNLCVLRGPLTIAFLADLLKQAEQSDPDKNANVTVFSSEFKVFSKGLYADSGLIERLTDVYDNRVFEYNTKGGGTIKIPKPCLNIKAASTPEWLTTGSANDFVGGGFSSRITPVGLLKDEKFETWPSKTDVERALEPYLINDLIKIGNLKGPFLVTQDAKNYTDHWDRTRSINRNPDRRFDGFYSKEFDMMIKVSMSLSAALSDDMVIDLEHVESAIKMLSKLEENLPFAYQGVAWGETSRNRNKVLAKIREVKEISHADLLTSFDYCLGRKDFMDVVHTLIEEEVVCYEVVSTKGRSKHVYKDRTGLTSGGKCSDINCTKQGCEMWIGKGGKP